METPQQDQRDDLDPDADQDAGPTASAEQLEQEPERDQAEGEDR